MMNAYDLHLKALERHEQLAEARRRCMLAFVEQGLSVRWAELPGTGRRVMMVSNAPALGMVGPSRQPVGSSFAANSAEKFE